MKTDIKSRNSASARVRLLLSSRRLRATNQRILIAELFMTAPSHMSVQELYQKVRHKLPQTSVSTVYKTMLLFEELGLVRRLSGLGKEAIFDSNTLPHINVVCGVCGSVEDVEIGEDIVALISNAIDTRKHRNPTLEITVHATCSAHVKVQ